jgi:hypothetical protein
MQHPGRLLKAGSSYERCGKRDCLRELVVGGAGCDGGALVRAPLDGRDGVRVVLEVGHKRVLLPPPPPPPLPTVRHGGQQHTSKTALPAEEPARAAAGNGEATSC